MNLKVIKSIKLIAVLFSGAFLLLGSATVDAGADKTINEGESVTLDGSKSTADDGAAITAYTWSENGTVYCQNSQICTIDNLSAGIHHITLTMTQSNGQIFSDDVTVQVNQKPNSEPIANVQSVTLDEDTSKAITLTGTDPDGDILTYTVTTQPAYGTLSGIAPNLTYTPITGYSGTDFFTFKVNDGKIDSNIAKVTITVNTSESNTTKQLNDPNVSFTTEADFNKSEYAKHHLDAKSVKKLNRTHFLVATAKDPDPAWFATKADKPAYVAKPGEEYTVNLSKLNKEGKIIGPVDNDKLRLVVRIQKSKNDYQYVTNVDIDNYARWDGKGILKIHVPDNLDKGRLLVGIRPNFTDVATNAIAERWSIVISAEVWQTKPNVKELDQTTVLFPVDTTTGFASESKFTKSEVGDKFQQQLTNNKNITLPIIVKGITLQKGDLVSYIYKNKPYAGKVLEVYTKADQQLALMTPEYTKVYNITDIDTNSTKNNGLSPEHVVYREGETINSDTNESDPTKFSRSYKKSRSKGSDIFDIECNLPNKGALSITFEPFFDLYPTNVGVNFSAYVGSHEVECSISPKPLPIVFTPAFGVGGPAAILMKIFGTDAKLSYYGGEKVTVSGLPGAGVSAGWSWKDGGNFSTSVNGVRPGSLNISSAPLAAKGSLEMSGELGAKFEMDAISPDGYLGDVFSLFGKKDALKNVGVEAKVGPKISYAVEALNAREVYDTGDSSKFIAQIGVNANIGFSTEVENFLAYLGINALQINTDVNILNIKSNLGFTYNQVNEQKPGQASVTGLRVNSRFLTDMLPDSMGVLALPDSSVFNDESNNISYDINECANNSDYKIISPAIACAGWMCGKVNKDVTLCKGKLAVTDVTATARVGNKASATATITNNTPAPISITLSSDPLTSLITDLEIPANGSKEITLEKVCSASKTYKGTIKVTSSSGLSAEASDILVCHDDDTRGDPHIVTADKLGYDFFASGDYILSRIKGVGGYEVQARFLPGYKTSWPQAVALQVGGDTVEIQGVKRDGHGNGTGVSINALAIWVNGEKGILGTDNRYSSYRDEDSIGHTIAHLPSGGIIAVTHTTSSNVLSFASKLVVIWPDGSPAQNYAVILSVAQNGDPFVHIQLARPDDFAGKEMGLMGNNDGNPKNDFMRRNGEVLGKDHNMSFTELYALFGADWLTRPYESLFRNPEAIQPHFPEDIVTLTPQQRALGEQACAKLTGFYKEACIYDVGLSGSAELVKEYYANTEDLNSLSDAIVTPNANEAVYALEAGEKRYQTDSGYYLHYLQEFNITKTSGEGKFMAIVKPPRGGTALFDDGTQHYTGEGDDTLSVEVDCTQLNSATDLAYLEEEGSMQLWLLDALSGKAQKLFAQAPLPCKDESRRPRYVLIPGKRDQLPDSNRTNQHYTQTLSVHHESVDNGAFILEVIPPNGAKVKLNGSEESLTVEQSGDHNATLELDCSMLGSDVNRTFGKVTLWEKDMLSGKKGVIYTSVRLSCRQTGVLQTGQIKSYAKYDDGYYQMGALRSYSRDDAKEIVTDNTTGLVWQDDEEAKTVTKNWEDAKAYCQALTLGGYSDWRLPTIRELKTIVDRGRYYPAINPSFQNVVSDHYWSSTTYASYTDGAWDVNFYYGYDDWYVKSNTNYVRCVRSADN